MTKRRKLSSSIPVKVEIKEENVQEMDYVTAKGRLNSVLTKLKEQSESDTESSDDNRGKRKTNESPKKYRETSPPPVQHTYVMKLFDRSVDLARFQEDTPLYPICRAWMENQPRNPQAIVKRRLSSPEPEQENLWNGNVSTVPRLPPPSTPFETRIPSPLPEQMTQNKDNINLDYNEHPPVPKDLLIKDHLQRWVKVKKKWIEAATKNEERYSHSMQILHTIYNRAQEAMEQ